MPAAIKVFYRYVTAINRVVGIGCMYMIFVMMGVLLFASFTRYIFNIPFLWIIEMSQFLMAAYYLLGGAYSMQLDGHVRMDVLYERWPKKKQAFVDSITAFCMIFYLGFLLYGGISSSSYALKYGQKNYSAWGPYMAPIKIIMSIGVLLMLLQSFALLFKDIAESRGEKIE
ncbi:MAG: TRAP transporter small permease subunit [Deltaproteobacteria bacterium]|nr:TRAP transporter small permease subunit [Deltaproteobacteria bacterium]